MPSASVRNVTSRHGAARGNGFAVADTMEAAGVSVPAPSGARPICCGVRENKTPARTQIVTTTTAPIAAAAGVNPTSPIAVTHSGENTTPPMLAPL